MKKILITALVIPAFLALFHSCKNKDLLPQSDKDVLFAAPSESEIALTLDEWQKRDLKPTDYAVVQENQLLNNQFTVKIVSYKVSGIKEYGALIIPKTDSLVPVRMFIGGFGIDVTTNSVELVIGNSTANAGFIFAIPALRGQSLNIKVDGTVYTSPLSEGEHCNAFDGATDDAIAFLNVIAQTEKKADVNRTSVRGGSRGGTVALLAGIRDKRVKRVVGVVSPTDLVTLTSVSETDGTYQCQFLNGVKNNAAALVEARKKLIASSPIYFTEHLPLAQLHMGLNDQNVPINQGYTFEQAAIKSGANTRFQLFTYPRTHSDIATNNDEMAGRIEAFLSGL